MVQAIIRRLLLAIPTIFGATLAIFLLLHLGPGDPAVIAVGEEGASIEAIERVREEMGLNDPMLVQYGRMLGDYARGDLGESLFSSETVGRSIAQRLAPTASLAFGGLLLGVLFAIPMGILAAAKVGSKIDRAVIWFSTLGIASPPFFIGLMVVLVFRETFLPATGYRPMAMGIDNWLLHLTLPAFTLSVAVAAQLVRHVRAAMLKVLDSVYIRTARAKGVSEWLVLTKHALKNASLTILTVMGTLFQSLVAGSVAIETVFNVPGIGNLIVRVAVNRDFPMLQGILMFIVFTVVLINITVDLLYTVLNPRVRSAA